MCSQPVFVDDVLKIAFQLVQRLYRYSCIQENIGNIEGNWFFLRLPEHNVFLIKGEVHNLISIFNPSLTKALLPILWTYTPRN